MCLFIKKETNENLKDHNFVINGRKKLYNIANFSSKPALSNGSYKSV